MSRRAIVAALLAAASACSIFTDFDGLVTGDDRVPDGSSDANVGADVANGTDAGPTDGGDGGGGDASFCSRHTTALFCEDFNGADPRAAWDVRVTGAGATAELVPGLGADGTSALDSIVPTGPVQPRSAAWKRTLAVAPRHFRFSYALRINERPTSGQYEIAILKFDGPTDSELYLAARSAGAAVDVVGDQGSAKNTEQDVTSRLAVNAWVRVEFEVNFDATPSPTVSLSYDGVRVLAAAATHLTSGQLNLAAGITYAYATDTSGRIAMDDILVESLP